MTSRLTRLSVSNFRSIRGSIELDLDAPVVLIHGPNGSGKTSLLSAIEFGLTGHADALEKSGVEDPSNLIHRGAEEAIIEISCRHEDVQPASTKLKIKSDGVEGRPLLDAQKSHLFSERCFLAQSVLSRLLEIYEHQDTRDSDSPLTRFVQELLGLDSLDNLIEGLDHVRDLRLVKGKVPAVSEIDAERKALDKEIKQLRKEIKAASEERSKSQQHFLEHSASLQLPQSRSIEETIAALEALNETGDEGREWSMLKREIDAAAELLTAATKSFNIEALQQARANLASAETVLREWEEADSRPLMLALSKATALVENLPSPETGDYFRAHRAAFDAVSKECDRERAILERDATNRGRIRAILESLEKLRVRGRRLEEKLSNLSKSSGELAAVLSQLVPLIDSETCPVCERDFDETSSVPLTAHLSKHIAELAKTAGELQEVSQERQSVARAIQSAERENESLHSELLSDEDRLERTTLIARLEEAIEALRSTEHLAEIGSRLRASHKSAAAKVSEMHRHEKSLTGLRESTIDFTDRLKIDPVEASEGVEDVLRRCDEEVRKRLALIDERRAARRRALEAAYDLRLKEGTETRLNEVLAVRSQRLSVIEESWSAFENTRKSARDLAQTAVRVRTDIVRRVFNDSLNTIWKDLFIRLAPDEQFIPAFALPQNSNGPVVAKLETLYRGTSKSGNPRAMLSAGNLNTAALTLFLSLHLSAEPKLPWLVIDDPVQSMDEIHIAQFAALLRTLSRQQHRRQTIIAVHEKSLFDYLALELSPAGRDDRLVTVELSRSSDKKTDHQYRMKTWNSDDVYRVEATG